jgi:hypothetical protein
MTRHVEPGSLDVDQILVGGPAHNSGRIAPGTLRGVFSVCRARAPLACARVPVPVISCDSGLFQAMRSLPLMTWTWLAARWRR